MPLTNAERQRRWREKHKDELAERRKKYFESLSEEKRQELRRANAERERIRRALHKQTRTPEEYEREKQANLERQRRWQARHYVFKPKRKYQLCMQSIIEVLRKNQEKNQGWENMLQRKVYQLVRAHKDKKMWDYLIGAIRQNYVFDDGTSAPVTMIGEGLRGDPHYLRFSDKWDKNRDWDMEQLQKNDPDVRKLYGLT